MTKVTMMRGLAVAIGRESGIYSCAISSHVPVYRSFASQQWRRSCINGRGLVHCSPSISLEMSVPHTTVLDRHFSSSSNFKDNNSQTQSQTKSKPLHSNQRGRGRVGAKADPKAISINKEIVALGRDGKWKEILLLYQEQKQHFNPVNYATVMSQLGRIRRMRNDDPIFDVFLADLSSKLHGNGIRWLGDTRAVANVVHAIDRKSTRLNSSHVD